MRNLTSNRTTASLLAAAAVLAAAFGVAELRPPADPAADGPAGTTRATVERTSAVCPQPFQGFSGTTAYTAFTPAGGAAGGHGTLVPVAAGAVPSGSPAPSPSGSASAAPGGGAGAKPGRSASAAPRAGASRGGPLATLAKAGAPVTAKAPGGDEAPAVAAVADGGLAPGFTVQQTTTATAGPGRGMSGLTCGASGTGFWFAGASTASGRADYVDLVNSEDHPAIVDVVLYGADGELDGGSAGSVTVPPGASMPILLSTLTRTPAPDLAVHVAARTGRVAAALHASDAGRGGDWLPAAAAPAGTVVVPGLPGDLASARLVVLAPGEDDADLKVQLSGPNGWFTPAGHETLHVKAGMVAAADLGAVTRGNASALRLSPTDPKHAAPVVAGLRVDRRKGGSSDAAWLASSAPVGARATAAENRAGASTLVLTSTGEAAKVRVTSSAGARGGSPAVKEVQLPAGGTVALAPPAPSGAAGPWAVTVETLSGGPVAAARILTGGTGGGAAFTVQPLQDDRSTVLVPHAAQDPAILVGG
ncbi:DUF5719 family protein [Streptomyces sp. NPDC001380]|uniref:DUF5719 family protein n=1 Tax=Streptomyces sp. NPDC001380 TaxID=3364566 RepID=UPI00368A6020